MHEIFNNDYYENWIMNQIKYVEKNFDNIFRIIRWRKNELLNQFDAFVAFATSAKDWSVKIAFVAFAADFAVANQNTATFETLSTVNFSKQVIENFSTFTCRLISMKQKKTNIDAFSFSQFTLFFIWTSRGIFARNAKWSQNAKKYAYSYDENQNSRRSQFVSIDST